MSMLDEMEGGSIEIPTGGVSEAAGEIKRKRGRPPGSKNKPKGEAVANMAVSLENAIRGIFAIFGLIAGWFGFEQTEELTEAEAKEGARAFAPIAAKLPWLAETAVWIGAPVWLLITMRKKFARKANATRADTDSGNRALVDGAGNRDSAENDKGEAVGRVSAG